jgi:hypothetical protein
MLRAKSMECISLVGMAVGKEKFRADAKQVDSDYFLYTFLLNSSEIDMLHLHLYGSRMGGLFLYIHFLNHFTIVWK